MAKKQYTEEEKEGFRAASKARVEAAVEAISNEDGFKRWLEVSARGNLGRFSFRNQLLIAAQSNGQATYALTRSAWKRLGRTVPEGAPRLWVLQPVFKPEWYEDPKTGERKKRDRFVGFTDLAEYDVSVTDGDPIRMPHLELDGDEALEHKDGLIKYAEKLGYTVSFEDLKRPGLGGYCDPEGKRIVVNTHNGDKRERSGNELMSTLIHEIAHAHDIDYKKFSRDDAEIIVEMTAALVLITAGLQDIEATAEYIAYWARGEQKKVHDRAELASKLAAKIEKAADIGLVLKKEEEPQAKAA